MHWSWLMLPSLHSPHSPWFFTGATAPFSRQSTPFGRSEKSPASPLPTYISRKHHQKKPVSDRPLAASGRIQTRVTVLGAVACPVLLRGPKPSILALNSSFVRSANLVSASLYPPFPMELNRSTSSMFLRYTSSRLCFSPASAYSRPCLPIHRSNLSSSGSAARAGAAHTHTATSRARSRDGLAIAGAWPGEDDGQRWCTEAQ